MVIRFYAFTTEMNNGALVQYFWNSSGAFAADQIADFKRIGRPDAAEIIVSGSRKIFGADHPPLDTADRRRQIDTHYGTHPFNDDDNYERLEALKEKDMLRAETRQFYDLERDLAAAVSGWFRQHPQYFPRLR